MFICCLLIEFCRAEAEATINEHRKLLNKYFHFLVSFSNSPNEEYIYGQQGTLAMVWLSPCDDTLMCQS